MQLTAMTAALCAALFAQPALADCSVQIGTGGALRLSAENPTVLSSEAGTGAAMIVTNLSTLLGTTITLSAPRLDSWPAGFAAGSAVVEQTYSAGWVLGSSSNSSFSAAPQSFAVPGAAVVLLVLNSRITAPGGFRSGSYSTKTIVACS